MAPRKPSHRTDTQGSASVRRPAHRSSKRGRSARQQRSPSRLQAVSRSYPARCLAAARARQANNLL